MKQTFTEPPKQHYTHYDTVLKKHIIFIQTASISGAATNNYFCFKKPENDGKYEQQFVNNTNKETQQFIQK